MIEPDRLARVIAELGTADLGTAEERADAILARYRELEELELGEALLAAIAAACPLVDPRLSEVDWAAVARELRDGA